MRWALRLVETGAEGEARCTDIMEIIRPDDLEDIADLGLTLAEAKLLQARVQQEISAAQARGHAVRRPNCRPCRGTCHLKDYRDHRIQASLGAIDVRRRKIAKVGEQPFRWCETSGILKAHF